jgi:transcriptional regulator with XRE-family HTH domain
MPDTFATFVRQRRLELKRTQRQIGDACGVTPEMVTQIEAGRRRPDPEWVPRLADALETDRAVLCRLAVRTWYPNFHAELAGEAVETTNLEGTDPDHRVSVELAREDADWLRSLKRLDQAAQRQLRQLTDRLAYPPASR